MPKGEFDTPGPFSGDDEEIYRSVEGHKFGYQQTVALFVERLDQAEREELIGLLNKGTHAEALFEALKHVANSGFRDVEWQRQADAAIAAYKGKRDVVVKEIRPGTFDADRLAPGPVGEAATDAFEQSLAMEDDDEEWE